MPTGNPKLDDQNIRPYVTVKKDCVVLKTRDSEIEISLYCEGEGVVIRVTGERGLTPDVDGQTKDRYVRLAPTGNKNPAFKRPPLPKRVQKLCKDLQKLRGYIAKFASRKQAVEDALNKPGCKRLNAIVDQADDILDED
jgi:hypothetical protein